MSAVNRELDPRAYAIEQRGIEQREHRKHIDRIVQLEQELRATKEALRGMTRDYQEDGRTLHGLSKLMLAATFNEQDNVLTITPLEVHADPDVSRVWAQIRKAKGA